jgi:hypothetical protein
MRRTACVPSRTMTTTAVVTPTPVMAAASMVAAAVATAVAALRVGEPGRQRRSRQDKCRNPD